MDERGDGEHNGRNRRDLHLHLFPRGERPPADQLHAGVIAWMEFIFNHEQEEPNFAVLLDFLNQNDANNNDNDENQGDENQDNENYEFNENRDNNENQDNNENHDNNENPNNNENHGNNENPNNNENHGNNENQDDENPDNNENHDNNENPNNNENHGNNGNPNNNENHDNNENQDNNENLDNDENHEINENHDNDDYIVNNDNNGNHDNIDAIHNDNVNNNKENAEDAGASAWVEVGVNQGVKDDDPLPGGSKRRSREEDEEDIERSSKKYKWWDEFAESSTDSDTDSTDCYNFNKKTVNSPVKHTKVVEEDPLPGPSRKRTRKSDRVENYRSSKKSRECYKFADKNCDTVTVTTGNDLAHFSGNIDMAKDAGAAEETDEEEEKQLDE